MPLYFYADILDIGIHRGELFGQLTLAGHGVGFRESDVAEFEAAETEAETHHGRLPLQDNPIPHVNIVDELLCIGDCHRDQAVTVDEILILVNIVLGNAQASTCPYGIPSGAEVDITVIIQAVNHALTNCPAS